MVSVMSLRVMTDEGSLDGREQLVHEALKALNTCHLLLLLLLLLLLWVFVL